MLYALSWTDTWVGKLLKLVTYVLVIVLFAWHIGPEIETCMRQRGFSGEIVDIISANDFV